MKKNVRTILTLNKYLRDNNIMIDYDVDTDFTYNTDVDCVYILKFDCHCGDPDHGMVQIHLRTYN